MTIFVTTCFAMAIIRCIEVIVHFFINYISSLTTKKKPKEVCASDIKRLVASVTPEIYELIKAHYALKGMTVPQFTLCAVIEKLKRDEVME